MASQYDLEGLKIKEKIDLYSIPSMIIFFVIILGAMHIFAAILSNRPIVEFGPLRTPIMLIIYAMVVFIIITLIQWSQHQGIRGVVTNGNVLIVVLLMFFMLVYVAYFNKELLPSMFSIIP